MLDFFMKDPEEEEVAGGFINNPDNDINFLPEKYRNNDDDEE